MLRWLKLQYSTNLLKTLSTYSSSTFCSSLKDMLTSVIMLFKSFLKKPKNGSFIEELPKNEFSSSSWMLWALVSSNSLIFSVA